MGPSGTLVNFQLKLQNISIKKMHLKMSSAKCQPFSQILICENLFMISNQYLCSTNSYNHIILSEYFLCVHNEHVN